MIQYTEAVDQGGWSDDIRGFETLPHRRHSLLITLYEPLDAAESTSGDIAWRVRGLGQHQGRSVEVASHYVQTSKPAHPLVGILNGNVGSITPEQLRSLQTTCSRIFGRDRETRLDWAADVLGVTICTFKDLSELEASRLIDAAQGADAFNALMLPR